MRLGISNIAWDRSNDVAVRDLLVEQGITAIDIAPGKYFPKLSEVTSNDIRAVLDFWNEGGIVVTGMQALLFGTQGLNLFGDSQSQKAMLAHLDSVCQIAGLLGAPRLTFGSPKNRDRSALPDDRVMDIAVPWFRTLGHLADAHKVWVCLEPNHAAYGANFMTHSLETARVVRAVDHPSIRMQLDTGALQMNGENPSEIIWSAIDVIGHIHLSEPQLAPLGHDHSADFHQSVKDALKAARHSRVYSRFPDVLMIEMVATQTEPQLTSIERALLNAKQYYGELLT